MLEYSHILLDHFANPRHMGEIAGANGCGKVGDPACGDYLVVWIRVNDFVIADIGFQCYGCPAAIGTSSVMTELVLGKTLEEAARLRDGDIADAVGGLPAVKEHCSNLGASALRAAIMDYLVQYLESRDKTVEEVLAAQGLTATPSEPKPAHLGPEYGTQFSDPAVVAAYRNRPRFPESTFPLLAGLLPRGPRTVLDAGCGTGFLARPLAEFADRVDAVDLSPGMVEAGRILPGGDDPRIRWTCKPLELFEPEGAYGLIVAGDSLHWMDWDTVLPRFRLWLAPGSFLALANVDVRPPPWNGALADLLPRFSTNQDYEPYNLVEELARRGLFEKKGEGRSEPEIFVQPLEAYVESFHARNGFSRNRLHPEAAADFDRQVTALVRPHCPDGRVALEVTGSLVWGHPCPGRTRP